MSDIKLDPEAFKEYITSRLQELRREGTYVHAIYFPNEMKEFLRDNLLNGGLTGALSYSTTRHGKVVPYLYGIRCEFVDRELSHPDWFVTDKNPPPPVGPAEPVPGPGGEPTNPPTGTPEQCLVQAA